MVIYKRANGKIGSVNYDTADTAFVLRLPHFTKTNPHAKGVIEWDLYKCQMENCIITTAHISIPKNTAHGITTKEKKQNLSIVLLIRS